MKKIVNMSDEEKLKFVKSLWVELGDICINEDDEIESDFDAKYEYFDKGTSKYYIWHWIEDTFNISVGTL